MNYPWLEPSTYEDQHGLVSNVTFVEGLVHFKGTWFAYYGQSDSTLGRRDLPGRRDVRRACADDLADQPGARALARGRGRPAARVRPRRARIPTAGSRWLDDDGAPELDRPVELWITCRMTHVYALGHLLGRPGLRRRSPTTASPRCAAGSATTSTAAGTPRSAPTARPTTDKTAYEHAFVVLAARQRHRGRAGPAGASCSHDALERAARALLGRRARHGRRAVGRGVHRRSTATAASTPTCTPSRRCSPRPTCSATPTLRDAGAADRRPGSCTTSRAATSGGSPSTSTPTWTPAARTTTSTSRPTRSGPTARRSATGWSGPGWPCTCAPALGDAAPGLAARRRAWRCSTPRSARAGRSTAPTASSTPSTGTGTPVVRERMHWVAAEATATAAALHAATGDAAVRRVVRRPGGSTSPTTSSTPSGGSWRHELSPGNEPSRATWAGKPDIYHAFQATLIPRLPLAPTLAAALRDGLLG